LLSNKEPVLQISAQFKYLLIPLNLGKRKRVGDIPPPQATNPPGLEFSLVLIRFAQKQLTGNQYD